MSDVKRYALDLRLQNDALGDLVSFKDYARLSMALDESIQNHSETCPEDRFGRIIECKHHDNTVECHACLRAHYLETASESTPAGDAGQPVAQDDDPGPLDT